MARRRVPAAALLLRLQVPEKGALDTKREYGWRECPQLGAEVVAAHQLLLGREQQEQDRRVAFERKPSPLPQAVDGEIEIAGDASGIVASLTVRGRAVDQLLERPITVLCLDEPHLEASRSFHDVLLPRLVLACTADDAASGWAWSIRSASISMVRFCAVDTCRSISEDEGRTSCLRLNVSFGITGDRPTVRSVRRTRAWPLTRSPQR